MKGPAVDSGFNHYRERELLVELDRVEVERQVEVIKDKERDLGMVNQHSTLPVDKLPLLEPFLNEDLQTRASTRFPPAHLLTFSGTDKRW